ncbi:unnamed protein product [Adineta ricciae]|uniref:PhoD-like phosphatase domain-containing protein n=1 Tax=Adineta ricciae TaxID=249248 RepID=A0A815DI71_ADIRI|nr:unnamed protein product [Adineta ricciae]CAF1297660.1 unnamed protein product [Adineta ricciae]
MDENNSNMKDKYGDWDANAPNPVNPDPKYTGDYPPPKLTTSKVPDADPSGEPNTDSSVIVHPPRPPGQKLGPFLQFLTTDLKNMIWKGSMLIFRHISSDKRPIVEFQSDVKIDFNWEVLYENLFNLRAYRVNLFIGLRSGEGNERIQWTIQWGDENEKSNGHFYVPRLEQKWRGGFFSCNGFDAYVPKEVAMDLTCSNVWNHLLSVHDEKPLHLLFWGGDQIYIDFIFEDVPFLRAWVNMEWNAKWTTDFRDDLKEQVEEYYFNTYVENWNCRLEIRKALQSIPSLMMWDDHDIFDGAGSYPPLLHDSPMMMGLFSAAQKMRLLFQHHTTLNRAREHYLFGHEGFNLFARCGRHLAIMGMDERTERNTEAVHHEKSWQMIFDRLENELDDIEHLIIVFPVPFSFVRVRVAESVFEKMKNLPNKWRKLPPVKKTNSIFGLPELYDDLLDEWTHEAHIDERNRALVRFQQLAEKKRVRITFFSGDVHCCGISRFQTRGNHRPLPIDDAKLMYQIISSAIVNMPPSKTAIQVAHRFRTDWIPVDDTEEEVIDFFNRKPENGAKAFHKKFRPNRNWCCFEERSNTFTSSVAVAQTHCFSCRKSHVTPISAGQRYEGEQLSEQQTLTNDLGIRLWLESSREEDHGRKFVGYDLRIPNLK